MWSGRGNTSAPHRNPSWNRIKEVTGETETRNWRRRGRNEEEEDAADKEEKEENEAEISNKDLISSSSFK